MSVIANHLCVYIHCSKNNKIHKTTSFFKFPVKDNNLVEQWKKNCGNIKIALMTNEELKNKLICEEHFSRDEVSVSKRRKLLRKGAVPVRFLETGKYYLHVKIVNKCKHIMCNF